MNKRYRMRKALFVFALFLIAALFPWPATGQDENNQGQRRDVPNLDVIIMVDESETMWNKTDTEGVRVNTVNYLIDLLSSDQSGATHRLALIAFGTEPRVIPYTLLDGQAAVETLKEQYATVHKQIEARKDLEYTDINKALQAALELLEQQNNPARKPAVILISDGQPTNPQVSEKIGRDSVETYLNETQNLIQQLGRFEYLDSTCPSPSGAPLYTVGMGVDKLVAASSPEFITLYREFWQSGSGQTSGYYREADKLQEMQGIGTYIFSELLCTPATPSLAVRANQVLEYQIFSSYYQIFFTISGKENPELTAKIYRPRDDGTPGDVPVRKDEEGVTWLSGPDYEVWGVRFTEPWAGTWRVVLEGEGRAEFSYVFFPNVTIDLIEPNGAFLPVERPFTIQAGIKDENGQPVDVPLRDFQVEIEGEGYRKQLSLNKQGDRYVTEPEALPKTGEYSLTLNAVLPDGTPLYEHKFVTLISAPWVEITDPSTGSSYEPEEAISLEAKIHSGGAASLEDAKLVATLLKDNEPVQTIEMSHDETLTEAGENVAIFDGAFQPVEDSGEYTLQAKLMTILPGGRVFDHETAPLSLSIELPPSPTPSPSPSPSATATSTPTATVTPVPVALAAPGPAPTLAPTPTPVPVSWLAAVTAPPFQPLILALLALLILLVLLAMLWRRRGRGVPDGIKLLAALMRTRRESGKSPYLLVLGSGTSVALGSQSMKNIVEAVADCQDLDKFYQTLDGFSPVERQVILRKQFEQARISSGYRHLAELVREGYFDIVFTTNLDPFLEKSLTNNSTNPPEFSVLVTGNQDNADILKRLNNPRPRIKIVKLHGDIQAPKFAFTPSEIALFGSESESILRRYFDRDLIVVDPGSRDHDVNRVIEREGGSIWYIGQTRPTANTPLHRAMMVRSTQVNVVSGEFGLFDRFFEALHKEIMRFQ